MNLDDLERCTESRAAWRQFLLSIPWTHTVAVNPLIPWLDRMSIQPLSERILDRLWDRLHPTRPFAVLIPERDITGMWHVHGIVRAPERRQSELLGLRGNCWIRRAVEGWAAHRSPDPARRGCSVLVRPVGNHGDAAIHYAQKGWACGKKDELLTIR